MTYATDMPVVLVLQHVLARSVESADKADVSCDLPLVSFFTAHRGPKCRSGISSFVAVALPLLLLFFLPAAVVAAGDGLLLLLLMLLLLLLLLLFVLLCCSCCCCCSSCCCCDYGADVHVNERRPTCHLHRFSRYFLLSRRRRHRFLAVTVLLQPLLLRMTVQLLLVAVAATVAVLVGCC